MEPAPDSETQLFVQPENQQEKEDKEEVEPEERPSTLGRAPMAYKEMPYNIYFITTTTLYVLEMIGAIFVLDIGLIFEFISAIAMSTLCFILPGVFFLIAERKWFSANQQQENTKTRYWAYFYIAFGFFMMIF